jgi:hypothetical protein
MEGAMQNEIEWERDRFRKGESTTVPPETVTPSSRVGAKPAHKNHLCLKSDNTERFFS